MLELTEQVAALEDDKKNLCTALEAASDKICHLERELGGVKANTFEDFLSQPVMSGPSDVTE